MHVQWACLLRMWRCCAAGAADVHTAVADGLLPAAPAPRTPAPAGQKMDAVIGAVPKGTLVQTVEKYLD